MQLDMEEDDRGYKFFIWEFLSEIIRYGHLISTTVQKHWILFCFHWGQQRPPCPPPSISARTKVCLILTYSHSLKTLK